MVDGVFTIPLPAHALATERDRKSLRDRGLHLAEFIAGPENRLAGAALDTWLQPATDDSIADDLRDAHDAFNPLVLYGPAGSGKSHFARGVVDWWAHRHPAARVICLAGSEFAQAFAAAVHARRVDAWRSELRGALLLVLEDLDQLAAKQPAQHELCSTLDALAECQARVIVTAHALPQHTSTLIAPLRSRLSAALAVPLSYPGREARQAIIQRFAAARGLQLSKSQEHSLAQGLKLPAPALLAALMELDLTARVDELLDAGELRRYLVTHGRGTHTTLPTIARATAKYFVLSLTDLKSASRRQPIVAARGVAMHLARSLTDNSLQQIGHYFGGRDHTTVINGCRRTERAIKHDPEIRQAIVELKKTLEQNH